MKKAVCLALLFIMLLTLCACGGNKGYLKSEDGDLVVSLPEKDEDSDINPYAQGIYSDSLIVGRWDLVKIVDNNKTVTYEDSYYIFDATGKYKLVVGEESRSGRFDMNASTITLSNSRLYYSLTPDKLELHTVSNKVHHLVRHKEEPQQ